jgi:hypothetical protein
MQIPIDTVRNRAIEMLEFLTGDKLPPIMFAELTLIPAGGSFAPRAVYYTSYSSNQRRDRQPCGLIMYRAPTTHLGRVNKGYTHAWTPGLLQLLHGAAGIGAEVSPAPSEVRLYAGVDAPALPVAARFACGAAASDSSTAVISDRCRL